MSQHQVEATQVGGALMNITPSLLDFIAEELLDAESPVDADTELLLSGMVDSLGVLQIVGYLEAELEIDIDPGEVVLENFQSVSAISAFAEARASGR